MEYSGTDRERELLELAIAECKNNSWIQGELEDTDGGLCAIGALKYASDKIPNKYTPENRKAYESVRDALDNKALEYLPGYYPKNGGVFHLSPFAYYNDTVATCKDDVLDIYEKVIADLQ